MRSVSGPRGRRKPTAAAALAALLAALLTLLSVTAAVAQAGAYEAEEISQSRDRVLADSRYQTERPEPEQRPEFEPFTIPPWLAETIFWAVIVGVAALVLFFLVNLLLDFARDRTAFKRNRDRPAEGIQRVETPLAERRSIDPRSLAEADQLAAEGRFGEAIHLLLLVAMERLHRELGPRVAPAMTSREVLRLPALPGATVEPLTRMVQLSEINHFGGRHAAAPDYRDCRADFLRFNGEEPVAA
ncbi:MAG: hypothetical protein ACFCUT_17950 [Kiloniellaceae bacterium]